VQGVFVADGSCAISVYPCPQPLRFKSFSVPADFTAFGQWRTAYGLWPAAMAATPGVGVGKRRRLQRNSTINDDEINMRAHICSKRVMPVSLHHDGTLLDSLASEHAAEFEKLLFQRFPRTFVGQRTWASCCSGSEGAHFVMKALEHAWPDVNLRQVFACEKDASKRDWIDKLVNAERAASGQELVCIFEDICDLGSEVAQCHTHGRLCKVPSCDVLVVGTSCKDLSKMSNIKFKQPVLAMHTSPGGAATTFRGLLGYLDSHAVDVVIYENSDNLDPHGAQGEEEKPGAMSNLDIFQSELAARRFEGQNMLLNAKQFGAAAGRRRFWSVLFKTGAPHTMEPMQCCGCTFQATRSGSCWAAKRSCCKASPCAEQAHTKTKCQNVSCRTLRGTL